MIITHNLLPIAIVWGGGGRKRKGVNEQPVKEKKKTFLKIYLGMSWIHNSPEKHSVQIWLCSRKYYKGTACQQISL